MKNAENRSNRNKRSEPVSFTRTGLWLRTQLPWFPILVLLLFSISLLFTRWMIGESKSGYMVNQPSPITYYALYQIRYTDHDSTEDLRKIAGDVVKGVVVEKTDVLNKTRMDLEQLRDTGLSEMKLSTTLKNLITTLSEETRSILGQYAFSVGQEVLHSGEFALADQETLSSIMWDMVEKTDLPRSDRNILYQILEQVIKPVVSVDPVITEEVRDNLRSRISPLERVLMPGDVIIQKGEMITPGLAVILRAQGYPESRFPFKQILLVFMGVILWVLWLNKRMYEIEYDRNSRQGWLYVTSLVGVGWVFLYISQFLGGESTGLLILAGWAYLTLPIELAFQVILGGSLLGAFIVAGFSAGNVVIIGLAGCGSGFLGYFLFRNIHSRSQLWRHLFFLGVFISILGISIKWAIGLPVSLERMLLNLFYSGLGALIAIALLPVLENFFDVLSPLRLLELSNPSHPLLKKLQIEAPGTYHHSLMVGNLAEAAADSLGLNSNLIKAGAYYHDIGKLQRPHFFVENQHQGDNVHDRIAPSLSALSIIAHVREGVELAREYKLPSRIRDFIIEHHGKTCLSYFYRKARNQGENIPKEQFCYPGPKPRTKETALLMLVDSIEAAVRADTRNISTPQDIEEIIQNVIETKILEGQLENIDFTLKDLSKVREALLYTLQSMYHTRRVRNLHEEVKNTEEGNE